jgi:Resolvase, N terminal domain
MKRVAICLRVSTSKQDTENQLRELTAVADRSGWEIWKVYEDAGISGAKGRDKRPGLDAMMKAVNAREFDMVAPGPWIGLADPSRICLASCKTSRKRAWTCFFISKGSTPRLPPAKRCSKCWAYLPNSSGALFGSGSTLASRGRGQRAQN